MLDFYCPSEQLAVELDGDVHDSAEVKMHDEERQKAIETLEIRVLRFKNRDVTQNMDDVLAMIRGHFGL